MPTKEWRKKNPEKVVAMAKSSNNKYYAKVKDDPAYKAYASAKSKAWYAANRERALAGKKANNAQPIVKARRLNNALLNMYGITAAERDALFMRQGSRCAVCLEATTSRRWEVDHCHKTGTVRGILCSGCNLMLGHGRDKPDILKAGAAYLEQGGIARIIKR